MIYNRISFVNLTIIHFEQSSNWCNFIITNTYYSLRSIGRWQGISNLLCPGLLIPMIASATHFLCLPLSTDAICILSWHFSFCPGGYKLEASFVMQFGDFRIVCSIQLQRLFLISFSLRSYLVYQKHSKVLYLMLNN